MRSIKKTLKSIFLKKTIVNLNDKNTFNLENRTAVITGASGGIGKAIAENFLQNGANVILVGKNENRLIETKNILIEKYDAKKVEYFAVDISNVVEIENEFANYIRNNKWKIDILINNAGVSGASQFGNVSEKEYDSIMNINLKGTFFISQVVARYMIDNKINGNILNIASTSALRPGNTPYILSKCAIKSLTLGMAKQLIKHNIIVNAVAPGPTATKMLGRQDDDDLLLLNNPSKRFCTVLEVANAVNFLVSSNARLTVGEILYMGGGAGTITYDDIKY